MTRCWVTARTWSHVTSHFHWFNWKTLQESDWTLVSDWTLTGLMFDVFAVCNQVELFWCVTESCMWNLNFSRLDPETCVCVYVCRCVWSVTSHRSFRNTKNISYKQTKSFYSVSVSLQFLILDWSNNSTSCFVHGRGSLQNKSPLLLKINRLI